MKAEDTVVSPADLCLLVDENCPAGDCEVCELTKQAEISFKAGIKEVVDKISRIHSSTSDLKIIERRIIAMLNEYRSFINMKSN